MDIIIAGGGVSAFEAALAARKSSPDCNIIIHSAESVPPYRRPALPGLISASEEEFAKIFIRKEDFYQANNIQLVLNSRLTGMDPAKKEVTFNGTQICRYDKLILATGGKAFLPPIPGIERDNVFALRTYDDLIRLRKKIAAGAEKFTIVGGGILGLELADALLKCNVAVTLLERSERLLKKDVSPEDSQMMMEKLQTVENFKLICSASTCEVTDKGVLLESGEIISSDVVIFSTGSRPELSGISSEITVDRGIVVNSRMESNIPDVYACGDNSQYDGNVCGLYTTSRAMAAVAGNNAAGNLTEYVPKHNSITLNVLGFKMSSDGKVTVK
jgi:nitrite reductase (NADH) large subunit